MRKKYTGHVVGEPLFPLEEKTHLGDLVFVSITIMALGTFVLMITYGFLGML